MKHYLNYRYDCIQKFFLSMIYGINIKSHMSRWLFWHLKPYDILTIYLSAIFMITITCQDDFVWHLRLFNIWTHLFLCLNSSSHTPHPQLSIILEAYNLSHRGQLPIYSNIPHFLIYMFEVNASLKNGQFLSYSPSLLLRSSIITYTI